MTRGAALSPPPRGAFKEFLFRSEKAALAPSSVPAAQADRLGVFGRGTRGLRWEGWAWVPHVTACPGRGGGASGHVAMLQGGPRRPAELVPAGVRGGGAEVVEDRAQGVRDDL